MHAACAALAAYVVWLLAFPMDGFLAAPAGIASALLWFLGPQALALLSAGLWLPGSRVAALSMPAAALAAAATAAFPWMPSLGPILLAMAAIASAPVALRVGMLLRHSPRPSHSAGWGLVSGNILLAALLVMPILEGFKAFVLAAGVALPAFLALPPRADGPREAPESRHRLRHYLPFLLTFHVVSGLFYDRLLPAYGAVSGLPGVELGFYAMAVLCAVYPLQGDVDGALALGIPLELLALLLFREGSGPLLHASMFTMQASAGFMDAFVLFVLLAHPRPVRAFGLGLAAVCSGIAGGKALSLLAGGSAASFTVLGSAALNVAVLSLYFAHRPAARRPRPEAPGAPPALGPPAPRPFCVSPGLRARLSAMEEAVLQRVLAGVTFRQVAAELHISESSVKTYMRRVYEKAGVGGKAQLLDKLARPPKGE